MVCFRITASLAMLWACSSAVAATCSSLEASLTAIARAKYEAEHVNVLYCLSLYPSGYVCGSDVEFNLESQELDGVSQRRIRYRHVGPPSTGGVVSVWHTAWESCSFIQRPEAEATEGSCPRDGAKVGHPVVPATGEKILDHVDHAGSSAHPLGLTRNYRSSRIAGMVTGAGRAGLGQPWSHNHSVVLERIGAAGTAGSTASVKMGDGNVRAFRWDVSSGSWKPANSADTLVANATGLQYKRLDDDSLWQFDAAGKLLTVSQRNGWTTTYTYSTASTPTTLAPAADFLLAVTNHFGRSLSFKYNASGQLASVTAPDARTTSYGYDSTLATGRLTTVSYPGIAGGTVSKTYLYENAGFPQLLTGVMDEKGVRLASYAYDAQGRGTSTQHAGGADLHTISYGAEGVATVTDPLGTQRTYSYGTAKGKLAVTGADKPSGTGNSAAAGRVQDANGFVTQETDFLGVNTMYTWDINRRLPLTTTEAAALPEARSTATQWHAGFRLPVLVTEAGRTTAYTYDGAGNPLTRTVTDTATSVARTTTWAYNPQGQVATVTTPGGTVASTYAYYSDTSFQGGQAPGSFDPNMASVSLLLHADGANGSATFTDSSLVPKTLSVGGNATTSTAQSKFGGSSIAFNGAAGYLSTPASASFDVGLGDFTAETWYHTGAATGDHQALFTIGNPANASATGISLGIHHLNSTGKLIAFVYSGQAQYDVQSLSALAVGTWYHVAFVRKNGVLSLYLNGVSQGSSNGNVAANPVASGWMMSVGRYANAYPRYVNGYLDDFRFTKGVARYAANFTPPGEAFPDTAAPPVDPNAAGHTAGDLQSITNAVGHVTQFTLYDRAGRLRQMVDPKGVVTDTAYTLRGWVSSVTVTPPGGVARTTSYTYDNAGLLTGVVLPDSSAMGYSYDAAHRLTGVTDAKGNSVTYTLDAMGNKVGEQVKDPQGNLQRNITRVYDALNRVQQVTGASN